MRLSHSKTNEIAECASYEAYRYCVRDAAMLIVSNREWEGKVGDYRDYEYTLCYMFMTLMLDKVGWDMDRTQKAKKIYYDICATLFDLNFNYFSQCGEYYGKPVLDTSVYPYAYLDLVPNFDDYDDFDVTSENFWFIAAHCEHWRITEDGIEENEKELDMKHLSFPPRSEWYPDYDFQVSAKKMKDKFETNQYIKLI